MPRWHGGPWGRCQPAGLEQPVPAEAGAAPEKPVKHLTAPGPVAKRTVGPLASQATPPATALPDRPMAEPPFPVRGLAPAEYLRQRSQRDLDPSHAC